VPQLAQAAPKRLPRLRHHADHCYRTGGGLACTQYFDDELTRLLVLPEANERLRSLSRELCASKLAEHHLLATLSCTRERYDGVSRQLARLKLAHAAAETRLVEALEAPPQSSVAQTPGRPSLAAGATASVVQLQATLVAKEQAEFTAADERRTLQLQLDEARSAAAEATTARDLAEVRFLSGLCRTSHFFR